MFNRPLTFRELISDRFIMELAFSAASLGENPHGYSGVWERVLKQSHGIGLSHGTAP